MSRLGPARFTGVSAPGTPTRKAGVQTLAIVQPSSWYLPIGLWSTGRSKLPGYFDPRQHCSVR